MRRLSIALVFVLAAWVLAACEEQPTGRLAGNVTVGPLQPVVIAGEAEPTPPPQVYTSRGIQILKANGETLVTEVMFSENGDYEVELPAGRYVVELIPNGVDFARELPAEVEIKAGESTRLDIDIDTGIR